jgi:hypothetical protein
MHLTSDRCPDRADKIGSQYGNLSPKLRSVCARMTTFLLVNGKRDVDREKSRFPLVNRSFFETKRNTLKSAISES